MPLGGVAAAIHHRTHQKEDSTLNDLYNDALVVFLSFSFRLGVICGRKKRLKEDGEDVKEEETCPLIVCLCIKRNCQRRPGRGYKAIQFPVDDADDHVSTQFTVTHAKHYRH